VFVLCTCIHISVLTLLLIILMWLHSEAAPIVDSATQRLLEENNQLLNQISANIKTFKVCIYLYLSCLWSALALLVLSSVSHKVHGTWKLFIFNYGG
jgi:hypothetical protein